jgi:pseudouridine kinase
MKPALDIIVIGGMNIDIKAKAAGPFLLGTSNLGAVTFTPGGVARNIAHNLATLGVNTALISVIGNDAPGEIAFKAAGDAGVDLSMALRSDAATGAYVALLDEAGELISAVNDMRILESLKPDHLERHSANLAAAKYIVVDCNVSTEVLEWLALHYGGKLIVEPVSVAKSQKLKAALEKHEIFLATPNRDQLAALGNDLHSRGLRNLVIHLGREGAFASTVNDQRRIPSFAASLVRDVTGAGDAAVAGLVYGLLKGYGLFDAARFGQAAASFAVDSNSSTAAGLSEAGLLAKVKAEHE